MRIISFLIFLLTTSTVFSQKVYHFDHMLETSYTLYKDSVKIKNRPFRTETTSFKRFILTNANTNSYFAILTEKDSLHYTLQFREQDKIKADVVLLKAEFNAANRITTPCKYVLNNKNHFRYQVKNYEFVKLKDTLIDAVHLKQVTLKGLKPQKIEKKKLGQQFYLIDTTQLRNHAPILTNATAYEEWKSAPKALPNGLLKETYFKDFYGTLDSKETVLKYQKIEKSILISKNCTD